MCRSFFLNIQRLTYPALRYPFQERNQSPNVFLWKDLDLEKVARFKIILKYNDKMI